MRYARVRLCCSSESLHVIVSRLLINENRLISLYAFGLGEFAVYGARLLNARQLCSILLIVATGTNGTTQDVWLKSTS
ncbi:hypothetical protein AB6A40_002724 [Gnathostoma spinigerum]|uniref:Uncharacterized protein n=1 Tax=Gnathostoma spinigerum TaxID=75299 RepID=A0ABD6E8K6_9BILA